MENLIKRTLVVFSIIGLLVSIYMTIYKLTDNNAMCLGSGDCSVVNASRYAEVNGVPVAVIGIIGYAVILGVLYFETQGRGFLHENGVLLVFGLALTGFVFTLWLIYVEVVLIKALCPFCITNQVAMTLIFILATIRLVRQFQT